MLDILSRENVQLISLIKQKDFFPKRPKVRPISLLRTRPFSLRLKPLIRITNLYSKVKNV